MKAVKIIKNNNGTYTAYIYSEHIYTGNYEDGVRELSYRGEYI